MEQFESTWKRIKDEDDPHRCQGVRPSVGQCMNVAVEGSTFCPAHGGNRAFQTKQKEQIKNYHLTKFRKRVQELGSSDFIIDLREEIGLLRLLIEEKVNHCVDATDLLLISGPLSDLIMKSEKLVTSCNRLDSRLGNHLDKTKVVTLAQTIVQIIAKHVTDDTILESISEDIFNSLN